MPDEPTTPEAERLDVNDLVRTVMAAFGETLNSGPPKWAFALSFAKLEDGSISSDIKIVANTSDSESVEFMLRHALAKVSTEPSATHHIALKPDH